MMNYFLLLLSFFVSVSMHAQTVKRQAGNQQLMQETILINTEKSGIEIIGKTNVNKFQCIYEMSFLTDSFRVQVDRQPEYLSVQNGTIKLSVADFSCENTQMTKDFRELLEYKAHPFIIAQITRVSKKPDGNYTAETRITLAGQENTYVMQLNAKHDGDRLFCEGKQPIDITDFGLEPPEKFFGMVKVDENINIHFRLTLNIL